MKFTEPIEYISNRRVNQTDPTWEYWQDRVKSALSAYGTDLSSLEG